MTTEQQKNTQRIFLWNLHHSCTQDIDTILGRYKILGRRVKHLHINASEIRMRNWERKWVCNKCDRFLFWRKLYLLRLSFLPWNNPPLFFLCSQYLNDKLQTFLRKTRSELTMVFFLFCSCLLIWDIHIYSMGGIVTYVQRDILN